MTGGGAGRRLALHPVVRWVLVVLIVGLPTAYVVAGLVQNAIDEDSGSGSSGPAPVPSEPPATPPASPPVSDPIVIEPPPTSPPSRSCRATPRLVDRQATAEATCLARQLDDWSARGRYGLGQQLNVSSADYLRPIAKLGQRRPALVGFDFDELVAGQAYGFATPPLDSLMKLAQRGAVLTASWHTPNPRTGGSSSDRSWQRVEQLLQPGSPAYRRFWAGYDDVLDLLRRLQSGDGGRFAPAAVLFRPLHEANGDWFWWAQGVEPAVYRDLYAALQARAAEAGVHNVVWGWSANVRDGDHISDPLPLVPDRLDLVGIDVYEPMAGRSVPDRQLDVERSHRGRRACPPRRNHRGRAARQPRRHLGPRRPGSQRHRRRHPTCLRALLVRRRQRSRRLQRQEAVGLAQRHACPPARLPGRHLPPPLSAELSR